MTIQFKAQWQQYEQNGVYTLSGAEEARLIGLGIAMPYVSPASPASGGGAGLEALTRQDRVRLHKQGAAIVAAAWAATTAYTAGQVRRLPNGDHVVCVTAGTSGGTAPAFSSASPRSRLLTDGTVQWGYTGLTKTANDDSAPTVSTHASVAAASTAAGITLSQFDVHVNLALTTANGGSVVQFGGAYLSDFAFASGNTSSSGNATGGANNAGFTGDAFQTNYNDKTYYVTDSVVALVFWNNSAPQFIEIDGQMMEAAPSSPSGSPGAVIMFQFAQVKRREVRLIGADPQAILRAFALSAAGSLEAGPVSPDSLLVLGDSYWSTFGSVWGATVRDNLFFSLKAGLGFGRAVCANVGGSGYTGANLNTYSVPQVLSNGNNQTLFARYAPTHIAIGAGFNDVTAAADQIYASAQTTWQLARSLHPNAKISVIDGWGGATGPSAAHCKVSDALRRAFDAWGDRNARFIPVTNSLDGSTATGPLLFGTGTVSSALSVAGTATHYIGADGTHLSPEGARNMGAVLADRVRIAWDGNY